MPHKWAYLLCVVLLSTDFVNLLIYSMHNQLGLLL